MQTTDKTKNILLTLSLLAILVLMPGTIAAGASLATDKQDYEPGETVIYTASGFTAAEVVNLSAKGSTNGTEISVQTTADANGCVNGSFDLPLVFEQTYALTAIGASSGLTVSIEFLDFVGQFVIQSPSTAITLYPGETQLYTVLAKSTGGGAPPIADVPVNWTATGGTMSPTSGKTGADGKTSSTYTAGSTPGTYTVTATAPGAGQNGHDKVATSLDITILPAVIPGDTTTPTTTIALDGTAGNNGWYRSDVGVTLSATDSGGSGVEEIHYKLNGGAETTVSGATANFSISADGTYTLEYWAIDKASPANIESHKTATIKIDKTLPVVTIQTPAAGWYRTDTLPALVYSVVEANHHTDVNDGWSTAEGEHTVTVTVTDDAGNVGSASVTYSIDNTPPETVMAPDGAQNPGCEPWYVSDVTVTLTATDSGSGVKAIHYILNGGSEENVPAAKVTLPITNEGTNTLEYWACDAVNEETHHSDEIKIDKTAPTIIGSRNPAANSYGWNNTDVTVSFETSDAISGIDIDSDPPDVTVSDEGADQSVSRTVYDEAGNSASATVNGINIDKTKPVVTIIAPAEGAAYILNQNVSANWSATDALSGIASSSGTAASGSPIPTGAINGNTFTVDATDKAGNTTTVTRTYYVRFNFIGFLPPVDNPSIINVGKAGRTFPMKWQLKDANGKFITDLGVVLYNPLRYRQAASGSSVWYDTIECDTSGASGLRFDAASNQYIFNWQTNSTFAGKTYECLLELKDGSVHNALFKFTK